MDEKIDILDRSGNPTGEVAWKSEAHRRGLWHRCFHCWISGEDEGGPYLLVQRRAKEKDVFPDRLDVTAAGHLRSGEGVFEGGLRELEEELGIRTAPEQLIPLGTRRIEQEIPGGLDREFHEVFLLLGPILLGRLQRGEVAAVLRLGLDEADRVASDGKATARAWSGGEWRSEEVGLSDFVPNEDGYLARIVRAAREALSGGRPGRVFQL
jgi:8-oxo-dGTP pyrophosphatase MutT (NUDIX family)